MTKRSRASTSAAAASKRTRPSDLSSQRPSQRASSPREALAAASQATAPIQTFELELLESQPEEAIVRPAEGSELGTVATTEAGGGDSDGGGDGDNDDDATREDNFDGIDWARLKRFMKPLKTQKRSLSWIFQHGYRVVERNNPSKVWFVCKYCHTHKIVNSGTFNVSRATSAAAFHLGQLKRGHLHSKDSPKQRQLGGQLSLRQAIEGGISVS